MSAAEHHLSERDLDLLERIYGAIVRFHDQKQVFICSHCHGQRTLHRNSCPFREFGALIDRLQSEGDATLNEEG
jgi:hypothetical protein